jgi:hypothetical protein
VPLTRPLGRFPIVGEGLGGLPRKGGKSLWKPARVAAVYPIEIDAEAFAHSDRSADRDYSPLISQLPLRESGREYPDFAGEFSLLSVIPERDPGHPEPFSNAIRRLHRRQVFMAAPRGYRVRCRPLGYARRGRAAVAFAVAAVALPAPAPAWVQTV